MGRKNSNTEIRAKNTLSITLVAAIKITKKSHQPCIFMKYNFGNCNINEYYNVMNSFMFNVMSILSFARWHVELNASTNHRRFCPNTMTNIFVKTIAQFYFLFLIVVSIS